MTQLQMSYTSDVARRLERLAEYYEQGPASELMSRTLDKLLTLEANACQEQLRQLHTDLVGFEQQYGLPSAEFYLQFQSGQTDDRMDYVEWASLYQMKQDLEKRLFLLTGREDQ
jgi:hypothetical protein